MKLNLIPLLITALILFTSCDTKSKQQEENRNNLIKANAIIDYTNKVINESNSINDWLDSNERDIDRLAVLAENPKKYESTEYATFFLIGSLTSGLNSNASEKLDLRKVSTQLDSLDQVFFKDKSEEYYRNKSGFLNLYNNIESYLKGGEYKVDKGTLGKLYADSIKIYLGGMYNTLREMTELATDLGEDAEFLTLENSPQKDLIMLMREQMKNARLLIAAFYNYDEGNTTKEDVLKLYDTYVAATKKNTEKTNNLNLDNSRKYRFSFFQRTDSELALKFEDIIKSIKAGEKVGVNRLESLGVYYSALIKHYNSTIN